MPNRSSPSPGSGPSSAHQKLTDRVVARLADARLAVDAKPRLGAPSRRRRNTDQSADALRETRALRRVFLELGTAYRSYRRRTGEPVEPAVRDAAYRFRKEQDLTSLVAVAATLERIDAVTW